ncbi:MAG TPA: DUF2877 domain-containing protein [Anaerolineales bacterium]|nr:DUF2877 domain-containing protein [Anaerolineales bacterium]
MQFHAFSIGEAVPRENFDARVQSVFHSAVNLRLTGADRLITLLISDHYELPQGIRIADGGCPLQTLDVDLWAASRGGVLRFESSPLTVDLRGASVWKCHVSELNADLQSPAVIQAWSSAWEMLIRGQRRAQTEVLAGDLFQLNQGSRLSQKLSWPVVQLITSTAQLDVESSIHAAQKMIGLGPGVTPSGDDLLIGFLAGLWSTTGQNPDMLAFLRAFGPELMHSAGRTNQVSRTYLYHATCGQFSSSLSHLAEAIANGDPVETAAEEAMRIGHSSGMDSVTGLLIGLCVWNMELSLV